MGLARHLRVDCGLHRLKEAAAVNQALILKRNATRDYIDFVAMHDRLGMKGTLAAMSSFDRLYPQRNGESPIQHWSSSRRARCRSIFRSLT